MTGIPSKSVERAWARLVRVQQDLLRSIEGDLKQAGLPALAWYDILLELVRSERGRLRPAEIERETLLAQYNLSRLIDRLEREAMVQREACEDDGRGQWIAITSKGRALQKRMWPVYAASIGRHVGSRLAVSEAERLVELLGKLAPVEPKPINQRPRAKAGP